MNIGPCTSCWTCWRKTQGKCVQKDDFQQIADAYMRADYFLIAAPLYYFSFPATIKNVIDRFFCFLERAQQPRHAEVQNTANEADITPRLYSSVHAVSPRSRTSTFFALSSAGYVKTWNGTMPGKYLYQQQGQLTFPNCSMKS